MIIKRGSRDTRGCLPVNESIKKPVTCQEDYAKVKKGKTQEVHKDETSWDAFVKSFKDWMTNIWTDSFASIKFLLLSHPQCFHQVVHKRLV